MRYIPDLKPFIVTGDVVKSMLPLVSIGIPTFNRGSQLENIVRIVLSQTYSNLQVIVVDNHSTDYSSLESLRSLIKIK